jgi:signal peptidase I
MLQFIKVSGKSLLPEYREGDFVLVAKIPFFLNHIRRGDIVVFNHPVYGLMIKRVDHLIPKRDEIYVIGTHEFSVDSREFGPISRKILLGKVIWHIQKSR